MKSIRFTHCLVGVVAAVVLLSIFGVQAGTLFYLAAVLACPLMMIFMMRGMMGGHGAGCDHPDHKHTRGGDSTEPAERSLTDRSLR